LDSIKINDKNTTYFYNSIRLFYANGGSSCYILSVGTYENQTTVEIKQDAYLGTITVFDLLVKEFEPTMVVMPDAIVLGEAAYNTLYTSALKHCSDVQSRVCIFDLKRQLPTDVTDDLVEKFRLDADSAYPVDVVADATALPFRSGALDRVASNSVLEHIPDLETTIAEIARLLRKDGRFVFTVPGPGFHRNLAGSVLPFTDRTTYLGTIDRRLAHHHYLSPADWSAICGRNGLVLDTCLGYLDGRETRRWETLSRVTGGLLYSLFGEIRRPIEIQRRLGARDLQNKTRLPVRMARALARLLSLGAPVDANASSWIEPDFASCFLVEGHRA